MDPVQAGEADHGVSLQTVVRVFPEPGPNRLGKLKTRETLQNDEPRGSDLAALLNEIIPAVACYDPDAVQAAPARSPRGDRIQVEGCYLQVEIGCSHMSTCLYDPQDSRYKP